MPKVFKKTKPASRSPKKPPSRVKKTVQASNAGRYDLLLAAVEAIQDYGIFMLNPDGHILTWNRGAQRLKGYRKSDVLGKHFSLFYTEEDRSRRHPEAELKVVKKIGRYEEEGWRVRKNGTRFWASVVITKLTDKRGRLVGFSKVTRDLTARKTMEDKLQQAYGDLERRVQERTAELAEANAKLEENEKSLRAAVEVRDEFISIASHELKTPITSLKIQMQMLQARTKPAAGTMPSPERLEKFLGGSLRQVDRLTLLVEDLLDVARAQACKLSFHFERTDLSSLSVEVTERLLEQTDAAGCEVVFVSHGPVIGSFDRFRLEQVLVNLLTNAIKYAPGTRVHVTTGLRGDLAYLTVRDEGPGVPLEMQARLFERFERGTNARNVGGLGLGLFITREIVQGHRGSIRVESEPGKGAAFHVEIPLEAASPRS